MGDRVGKTGNKWPPYAGNLGAFGNATILFSYSSNDSVTPLVLWIGALSCHPSSDLSDFYFESIASCAYCSCCKVMNKYSWGSILTHIHSHCLVLCRLLCFSPPQMCFSVQYVLSLFPVLNIFPSFSPWSLMSFSQFALDQTGLQANS